MIRLLPALLALAGCGPDVSITKQDTDADHDGYDATIDCDDTQKDVNPDAPEVCDGQDNDCDGAVDDDAVDATTTYADTDGDGFGDAATGETGCAGEGVADATDCDDTDARRFPGNPEVCDGVDNNCDEAVDDGATDAIPVYVDADDDGYGDDDTAHDACAASTGEASVGGDCDDDDPAIHPDAPEADCTDPVDINCDGSVGWADADGDGVAACEDCDDTDAARSPLATERCDAADVDEDCDGAVDDADTSVTGRSTWYRDADSDGYGGTTTRAACEAPAGYLPTSTDCDDAAAGTHPAATETCEDGIDQDCSGSDEVCPSLGVYGALSDTDADAVIYGTAAYSAFGVALIDGDFDGDGQSDLAVGAYSDTFDTPYAGGVYGYLAVPTSGAWEASSIDSVHYTNDSSAAAGLFGRTLYNVGDLDEDGRDDLFVGSASNSALVWFGGDTGTVSSTTVDATFTCTIGRAAGGPGAPTWLCGNLYGSSTAGSVTVYAGTSASASATFLGETTGDFAGQGVAGDGDVDGDGVDDLWIGAPMRDESGTNTGTVYLFYGPTSGTLSVGAADLRIRGGTAGDYLGSNLTCPGDLDGDGHDDVAIGKLGGDAGGSDSGTVHLLSAPASGVITSLGGVSIVGDDANDYLGQYDPSFGDGNGDGVPDLLIGGSTNDDGGSGSGSAWVVYGPFAGTVDLTSADAEILGTSTSGSLGTRTAFLPDVNGDGFDEVVVSGLRSDVSGLADRGAVWIFLGG